MKRHYCIIVCLLFALSVSGCNVNTGRPLPVLSVTTEAFDLYVAIDMVQELERPILALNAGSIVPRSEFEEMQQEHELFWGTTVLYSFFDVADIQDASKQELEVLGNICYPTIFEEDVEITKAYTETTIYDLGRNMTDTTVVLHIEQEYAGADIEMKHFKRSYLFKSDDNSGWKLIEIKGMINFPSG